MERVIDRKTQFVADLREGDKVVSPFLVKFSGLAVGKNGRAYMNVVLTDKSGDVEARIWENAAQHSGHVVRDAFVWIEGKVQTFQNRKQVIIKNVSVAREDELDLEDYVAKSERDPEELYGQLLGFVESMQDPYYKALAESVLKDDADAVDRLKRAPAAKSVHHAYQTGLLEHVVSISGILDGLAKHYGSLVDRDLLLLGGFFHDICKLWELTYERVTDYSTEGKLLGHLVMGVELVERKVNELNASGKLPGEFPNEKKLLIKHIIASHHGKLEYGSPKRPKCLEALIVHYVDDLDSKVNAISEFIKKDQTPGNFTAFHRGYERFFYKPVPTEPS